MNNLRYFNSTINSFRAMWIKKNFGNEPTYMNVKDQNRFAEDYARHMVASERTSWKIVFGMLVVFIVILYFYER